MFEQSKGDRRGVEAVMNHRHVFDYFSHAGGSASEEQILFLGRTLKDIWETKLARDFPDRRFVVPFSEGPFEDLIEYQVTFFQGAPDGPDVQPLEAGEWDSEYGFLTAFRTPAGCPSARAHLRRQSNVDAKGYLREAHG